MELDFTTIVNKNNKQKLLVTTLVNQGLCWYTLYQKFDIHHIKYRAYVSPSSYMLYIPIPYILLDCIKRYKGTPL